MTDAAIKVIALLSTFAGRACLAAAVAIAALTPPLAPANATPAEERTPAGASLHFNEARSISIGRHQSWPGWRIICARRSVSMERSRIA